MASRHLNADPSWRCACNNGSLRRASRSLGQFYDAVLAPTGLRATQYGLLTQIGTADPPRMSELARRLVMDLSALGHSLQPLVRRGFVLVSPDPCDKRSKRVALTGDGRAKLREAEPFWVAAQARFEAVLGVEAAADLRSRLDGLASDAFMTRLENSGAAVEPMSGTAHCRS